MSAAPRLAPQPTPAPAPRRPALRLVAPPPPSRSGGPYLLTCLAVLAAALISVLLLNTTMAQGAYEQHDLEARLAQYQATGQQLREDIAASQAPGALAAAARKIGMVPARDTGYIRLSDGTILATPDAAEDAN